MKNTKKYWLNICGFALLTLAVFIATTNVTDAVVASCGYDLRFHCCGDGSKRVANGSISVNHNIWIPHVTWRSGRVILKYDQNLPTCRSRFDVAYGGAPTFLGKGGPIDTPPMYPCNNNGDCANFYGGSRPSGYVLPIDNGTDHNGSLLWQYNRSDLGIQSITSSNNNVLSCSGIRCTAVGQGTARITVNTKPVDPRVFAQIWYDDKDIRGWYYITNWQLQSPQRNLAFVNSSCSTHNNGGQGDIRVTLPSVKQTFDITVEGCPQKGICNSLYNGQTVESLPTTRLCTTLGVQGPVSGDGSIGSPWRWTCGGISGGTTTNCSALKKIESGECKSTVATEFSYETTDWPPPTITYSNYNDYFCLGGRLTNPQPPETRSGYIIPKFPNVNTTTTWTCSGINSTTNDQCEATRLEPVSNCVNLPGEYNTKPADNLLCQAPNKKVSGIDIRDPWDGKWWWTCSHEWFVGPPAHSDPSPADCSARSCLADKVLNYPAQVYLTKDGQSVNVSVFCDGTDGYKMCCDIGMAPVEDGTPDTHICSGESGEFVVPDGSGTYPAECYFKDGCENDIPNSCPKVDKPITIQTMCMAKSCNAQGTCQATPVAATSLDSADCKSSCNSNADCSSGRMIETKP